MIPQNFRNHLVSFKASFTDQLYFNAESPKRVQWAIEEATAYLERNRFEGELKKRVEQGYNALHEAHKNAGTFGASLKPDPEDKDLGVIHNDPQFWYQQVIGTAEAGMNVIIRYLDGNE